MKRYILGNFTGKKIIFEGSFKVLGGFLLCFLPAGTVFAEAAAEAHEAAVSPMMMLPAVLGLVLDVLLLIAVAYLWSTRHQDRKSLARLEKLPAEVKRLSEAVEKLESQMAPPEEELPETPSEPEAPAQPMADEVVWKPFVDDFNHLANSMNVPGAKEACGNFTKSKNIKMLICLDHAAQVDGKPAPKFVAMESLEASNYWAFLLPKTVDRYAVVPNPLIPYEQKLHDEGGMKETFASNFGGSVSKKIEVKLPALFHNKDGNWIIDQPGVIHLE